MPSIAALSSWIDANSDWLSLVGVASAVMFVASLALVPIIAARIPADYFAAKKRTVHLGPPVSPAVRTAVLVVRNLLGLTFLLAGMAMLVLPGQGLLTIFIGIVLMTFPGKYRLERWFITRSAVHRSINWMRRRAGKPPLEL